MPIDSHFSKLHKKWTSRHKKYKKKILNAHKEAIDWVTDGLPAKEKLAGTAVGALMLANTLPTTITAQPIQNVLENNQDEQHQVKKDSAKDLVGQLSVLLPKEVRPLTGEEEMIISQVLSDNFDLNVKAEIDTKRLNRTYGLIGAEQHLMRYPGDTMAGHLKQNDAANKYVYSSGMAPGRGAWGYFSNSLASFDQKTVEREKWYIAVQTFLAPDYNKRLGEYRDFFKFRKMILVNPTTGQAVVCDIGDAGPGQSTGKHLGGSPEVMQALGLHTGPRKGAVLYFFVDDPGDTIPLGPIRAVNK